MPYINIYFTYNDQKNIHNKEYENRQSCVKMDIFLGVSGNKQVLKIKDIQ